MGQKGKRTVDRAGYYDYIQSEAWAAVKRRYWASKKPKCCYVCGEAGGRLDLHHKTYKNLGNERLMDLVLVHRECHDLIHAIHEERTNRSDGLWQSTQKARTIVQGPKSRIKREKRYKRQNHIKE